MKTHIIQKLLLMVICLMLMVTACTASSDTISIDDQLSLGQKYLSDLDYENAILAFQKIIEVDPRNVQAYLGLAEAYEKTDKNEEAITALEKVIEIEPEKEEAYIKISDIYIKIGDIENAIRILMEALSKINSEAINQKLENVKSEFNSESNNELNSENGNVGNNDTTGSESGDNNLDFDFNTAIDLSSGFNVEILNDKTAILYLRDDNFMPTYTVGEYYIDGELMMEHLWLISFGYGTNSFEVGTTSFIEDIDSITQVAITDMYHDLWIQDPNNENHHDTLNEVGFKTNNNVLAYKVIVPEDIDFNFHEVDSYNIEITHDNGADLWDVYNASYTKDNNGNLIIIN